MSRCSHFFSFDRRSTPLPPLWTRVEALRSRPHRLDSLLWIPSFVLAGKPAGVHLTVTTRRASNRSVLSGGGFLARLPTVWSWHKTRPRRGLGAAPLHRSRLAPSAAGRACGWCLAYLVPCHQRRRATLVRDPLDCSEAAARVQPCRSYPRAGAPWDDDSFTSRRQGELRLRPFLEKRPARVARAGLPRPSGAHTDLRLSRCARGRRGRTRRRRSFTRTGSGQGLLGPHLVLLRPCRVLECARAHPRRVGHGAGAARKGRTLPRPTDDGPSSTAHGARQAPLHARWPFRLLRPRQRAHPPGPQRARAGGWQTGLAGVA